MKKKVYKRQYRELSNETKAKISETQRNKPARPQWWREKLSRALKDYWMTVPHRPTGEPDTPSEDHE